MSILNPNRFAKLFFSIIFKNEDAASKACLAISQRWGDIDFKTDPLPFCHTKYYEKEFGPDLSRIFISLSKSICRKEIVDMKIWTDNFEKETAVQGLRIVNIDPGYVCLEQVILATGKNYTHRMYLDEGVFADLTLVYEKGSFRTLPWTYPDYAEASTIEIFNKLRMTFLSNFRGNIKTG
jgi:hypothetical protein